MPIETLLTILLVLVGVLAGYGIGCLSSGIKIYHLNKLPSEKEQEYNETLEELIPPEHQAYYQKTQGRNLW